MLSDIKILEAQRSLLEIEADAIQSELTSPGLNGERPAGVKDSLIDSEGYPRADIDIVNVKAKRHRLAVINYDYNALMKEIETKVQEYHASLGSIQRDPADRHMDKESTASTTEEPTTTTAAAARAPSSAEATEAHATIATINEILSGSPAAECGLIDGDELISFGTVNDSIANPLSNVPDVVKASVNKPITLLIKRNNVIIELFITPRTWAGRGLLGLHLSPKV